MAEFAVKAVLIADNRGFKGPVEEAKRSIGDLEKSTERMTAAEFRAKGGMEGLAQATERVTGVTQKHTTAMELATKAARTKQQSMRMVGIQLGDVSQQLAMGVNPAIIFGQQIGQIGLAAEGLGGKLGKLAQFMSTPWGAALQLGVILLGSLAASFFKSGDASDKSKKAIDLHKMSTEELTKAIDEQNVALGKAIQTSKQAEDQSYANARATLNEVLKRRENIKSILEERKARFDASEDFRQQRGTPTEIAAETGAALSGLQRIQAELDANAKEMAKAQTGVRLADIPRMAREVKVATDALAAAEDRHTNTVARLNDELKKTGVNRDAIKRQLIDEEKRYKKETEALRENSKARKENNAEIGRDLSSDQAAALIRAAGGRVTDQDRTFAEQKRLYDKYLAGGNLAAKPGTGMHEQKRALDIVGLSAAKIKDIFREAGVRIIELKKYADGHIHVAWAKSAGEAKLFNEQLREQKEAAREAEQALLELQRTLDDLTRRFDPATARAKDYADTLADIERLAKAGTIDFGTSIQLGASAALEFDKAATERRNKEAGEMFGAAATASFEEWMPDIARDTGEEIAITFGEKAADVAARLGDIIGGRLGSALGGISQLIGSRQPGSLFQQDIAKLSDSIATFGQEIGLSEKSAKSLGKYVGQAAGGAATGSMVAGIGKALGIKLSGTGAQIGGAIGSFLPIPGGDIIGSILGGLVGKLFGKTKKGVATVTDVFGDITATGNSASRKEAAEALGGSIQGGIQQIADALGGTLGDFAVSIGVRKKKFVVDPSGSGKTKGGGVQKFENEADAIAAAMRDAIADGAVQGLSAAVQQALRSSSDIDKALREALKVQELETLLEGIGGAITAEFKAFDRLASERVRLATKYGFDLVKLEKFNAEERAKMFDQILGASIGPLKDLLDEISFGDLFEGSAVERLAKLRTEADKATADMAAGIEGAGDRLAGLNRDILGTLRETFGTAGGEFATGRADVVSATERAIQLERERVTAAAKTQEATNSLLDENNSQNAVANVHLASLDANMQALLAAWQQSGAGRFVVDTGFAGALNF